MGKKFISIDSSALESQIKKAILKNKETTLEAIKSIALDLQSKSAQRAPVDTGDLRNNCNVNIGSTLGIKVSAIVGYNLPYALRQHEDLTYNHPKGGEPKFLERPFEENKQSYINLIKAIPNEVIK